MNAPTLTADGILAATDDPAEVLAGYDAAVLEAERANAALVAANAATEAALQEAQAAARRMQAWSQAVERLHAAASFLNHMERN